MHATTPLRLARQLWQALRLGLAGLALATLAACAQGLDTHVTRFSAQLPAPSGQSFTIVADSPALAGGIEFNQYARLVAGQLTKAGYTEAAPGQSAALVARLDYGVDHGREKVDADPTWGTWYGFHGGWGRHAAWGWGWHDPWFDAGVTSYTLYTSNVSLKIDDAAGKRLFEGRAEAVSTQNRLSYLVPNLIEALFTRFPGNSGQTEHITIAPEEKPPVK